MFVNHNNNRNNFESSRGRGVDIHEVINNLLGEIRQKGDGQDSRKQSEV